MTPCRAANPHHLGKQRADVRQATFAIEILYYAIVYLIKVSIILLYLRFGKTSAVPKSHSSLGPT